MGGVKVHPTEDLDLSDEAGLEALPPRERAQMRRLRGWLRAKRWTPGEAEAILCGYDPNESASTGPEGLAFLPGAWAFYGVPEGVCDPDDLLSIADGIDRQREAVRGLRLVTACPKSVIEKVHGIIEIPWLNSALNDSICRELLPVRVVKAARPNDTGEEIKPQTLAEFRSKGGQTSAANNSIRKTFFPIVERLWRAGDNVAASIDKKIKAGDIEEEINEKTPDAKTIGNWLNRLRDANPEIAATMAKSKGGRPRKKTRNAQT